MRLHFLVKFSAGTAKVLMVALLLISSSSSAAMFEHTPPQQLVAGETLSVVLRLSAGATPPTHVSIVNPTADMTLTRMTRARYLLRWDSPEVLPKEQIITVLASVSSPRSRVEKHHIVVRSRQTRHSSSALPATTRTPGDRLSLLETSRHTKPRIEGISTHIISAGQTVKFRIHAPIENARSADISVDELPPNARIDTDIDGVPIFIWKTESTDSGEQRLLFTATHPSMADLQDTAEAVVIVEYSNASGASDIATASDESQTSEELAYPDETLDNEIGTTKGNNDGIAPEGAEYFADPYHPPTDYPTDSPPDFSTESPPDFPTESPPNYPTDSPVNGPAADYFAGPEPGISSPPPDSQ